jgi:hypothetical protein
MNKKDLLVIIHKMATKERLSLAESWAVYEILQDIANRPEIVTLCGPSRFGTLFHEVNLKETLAQHFVLSIGIDTHSDGDLLLAGRMTPATKERLDLLHFKKVKWCDRAVFLNGLKNGKPYLGQSSLAELAYTRELGRNIEWYNYPTEYARDGEGPWKLK